VQALNQILLAPSNEEQGFAIERSESIEERLTVFRSIFTSIQGYRIRISEEYASIIQGFGVCDTRIFLVKVTAFCISSPVFRVQGFSLAMPNYIVKVVTYQFAYS